MTYNQLIKEVKKKYKDLLKDVRIEILDTFCFTEYQVLQKSIIVSTIQLKASINKKRFIKRFGRAKTFNHGLLIYLLHEIGHVKQEVEYGIETLYREQRNIIDSENHDGNWLEIEADRFARQEAKKWDLTKLK